MMVHVQAINHVRFQLCNSVQMFKSSIIREFPKVVSSNLRFPWSIQLLQDW